MRHIPLQNVHYLTLFYNQVHKKWHNHIEQKCFSIFFHVDLYIKDEYLYIVNVIYRRSSYPYIYTTQYQYIPYTTANAT